MKTLPNSGAIGQSGLVRETLTRQVCNLLRSRILNGEWVSGMRIWADDLAKDLGVSIAPVKEALLMLAADGLINNIPRRGSVVRTFSLDAMRELYEVRRLLEIEALDIMFARNLVSDEFVDVLMNINQQIEALTEAGEFVDRKTAFELDWEFHQRFMENCRQNLLVEIYSRINTQAQIVRVASWSTGPRGNKTVNEHGALVDALSARDQGAARSAILSHLDSITQDFEHKLDKLEDNTSFLASQSRPTGRRKPRIVS